MSGQELRQEKEQELEPHVPAAFLPLPANEEASAVYKAIRPEPELSDIVNARGGLYLKILQSASSFAELKPLRADALVPLRIDSRGDAKLVQLAQLTVAEQGKESKEKTAEDRIKRDSEGRVVEIKYPDDGVRKFTRDENGQLVKIEQPDGAVHERGTDGKWSFRSGRYLYEDRIPIDPQVSAEGSYNYSNSKGEKLEIAASGAAKKSFEGTTIYANPKGEAYLVEYKSGRKLAFETDLNGLKVIENGNEKRVWSDQIQIWDPIELKYRLTGIFSPRLDINGVYTAERANGDRETIERDGVKRIEQANKAVIEMDLKGQITKVLSFDERASGKGRSFEYDEKGRISKYNDGFRGYERQEDGSFATADGEVLRALKVLEDGTIKYEDREGRIHTEFSNGIKISTEKGAKELEQIAEAFKTRTADPDFAKQMSLLNSLSVADREELKVRFRARYGMQFSDELKSLNDPGKADNLLQIQEALSESQLKYQIMQKLQAQDVDRGLLALDAFRKRANEQGLSLDELRSAQENLAKDLAVGSRDDERRDALLRLERGLSFDAPTLQSLGLKYGLEYESKTGRDGVKLNRYFLRDTGASRIQVLEARGERPQEIDRQIKVWQAAKIESLEGKFNVSISRDGQKDGNLELRTPLVSELVALEQGLSRSQPSSLKNGGRIVEIQFLKTRDSQSNKAYVSKKDDGQQIVRFQPRSADLESLRGTVLHEWGHIAEENVDKEVFERYSSKLGFRQVKLKDEFEKEISQWQLKGKDGFYYAQLGSKSSFDDWYRVDENGRPLKQDGSNAGSRESKETVRFTNEEMRLSADVTPASDYFPNPSEALAETLKNLREGKESRRRLYHNGIPNYFAGKQFDQAEIDKAYGKNTDGTSAFIRLPDSSIVKNTQSRLSIIANFERQLSFEHHKVIRAKRTPAGGPQYKR